MNHTLKTPDSEAPSSRDAFLGMVSRIADESYTGATQTISCRLPVHLACMFEAMSKYSGKSRNRLIVKALEMALEELWSELPEVERQELESLRGEFVAEKLAAANVESGSL